MMQKHKKTHWIALVCCLLFLVAMQTAAFGAVPYEIEACYPSGSGVHLTYTAGDTQNKTLTMNIKDVNANDLDKVTFSFPGTYFNVVSAVAGGQNGTINGNVVSFEKIKPTTSIVTNADGTTTEVLDPTTQTIPVTFTVVGNKTEATLEPQIETVSVSFGGSNQVQNVDVKVVVNPAVIDITKATFKVDYLQYHKQPHLNENPQMALANVVVNFADQYGNPSTVWPTGKSAYLAAEGVAGLAEITQTTTNGTYSEVVAADSTPLTMYELKDITDSNVVLQIKGKLGSSYTLSLGLGDSGASETATIRSYFSNGVATLVDYKVARLNITGINVNTHNEGQIKIDLDIPNYDLTGKTVEVKLPANFITKETQENGRLTLPLNGSLFANVVSVPGEGLYDYSSTDGDYKLYIDGVEYMLTNYDGCQIRVDAYYLTVLIDNELEFRHGNLENGRTAPQNLTFTISGIDTTQVDKFEFKINTPELADGCTNSAEMKFKDDGSGSYTYDAATNTVIVSGQFEETQTFTFPVEYGDETAITEGLNEIYPIEIVTRKSSGKLVEKSNNVKLRYRVTDTVIDASQTTFTDFRTVSVSGNQCAVEIKMTINESELNGRGIYLWITDEYGNIMNVKDRFDIQLIGEAADALFLMNTELAAVEGSVKGDRNVFRIFKNGADTTVDSIEEDGPNLGVKEMLFRITSALDGNFRLNIATGRNAQEALANAEIIGSTNHKESDSFVFIQENDLPIINIRNVGEIYYNYLAAGLTLPGPGLLEVEIANIEFPEDPNVPDNLYIKLPAGLTLYDSSDEKYGSYNENGYLKLNQNNALPKDETTGKKHYRWQIPLAAITDDLTTAEMREAGEERVVDGTELTYYRGINFAKKQEIRVDITSSLTFKSFIANLYQFLQASFSTPAYPTEDISLTIAPQETIYTSNSFDTSKGILFWFSNGSDSILTADQVTVKKTTTDAEGKATTEDLLACTDTTIVTEGQNKFVLDWLKDADGNIQPGKLAESLTVQFAEKGTYQLNIALTFPSNAAIMPIDAEADDEEEEAPVINPASDISVPNTTTTMYVQIEVTEKATTPDTPLENETWDLALTVDGTAYTAVNHVYNISGKKIGEKIALAGKLTDKSGNALVGVQVALTGTAWTYTGTTTAITSETGEFAFEISATTEGLPHLLTLGLNSTLEDNPFATTYSLQITVTDGTTEETLGEYTVDKVGVVSTVAIDEMAVVYLEVYDAEGELIKITSNSQARGIFKEIEFRDLPERSDLYDTNIYVQANNGGIEVYFYPDCRGDYYIRMTTNSTSGQIINASFEAIWQNEIKDMQLLYPEKNLGIGQTSSIAQILTYDKDGIEAESAIVKYGWEYFYQGSAVKSMDEWGRVTLKNDERYIGSTVTVTVYNERYGLSSTYTFNVDDNSYIGEDDDFLDISGIVLENDYGAVGKTNQYQFYLVDRNGFTVELADGQMSSRNGAEAEVTVYSKPYGATVNAYISNNGQSLEDSGFGYLYVDCDKEGTVRLNIRLKIYKPRTVNNYTYNQYEYYSKTIELQIKDNVLANQAISTDKTYNPSGKKYNSSVAIFLGTNHYRVNMNDRIGEAKPFMQDDSIMVPLRTLTDGLGANLEENKEKQTITIKFDGKWAMITYGSNIIKTNFGSVYSDIMPTVVGGYTYLPLRSAAEALGCEVEGVSNLTGETIGAIFLY